MDDHITYGVFWKSKYHEDPNEWISFSGWYSNYDEAANDARLLRDKHPACLSVKVVERVEMYEDVPGTLWERRNHD